MNPASPTASVLDEVTTWPGISTQLTPRGSTAIVFKGHELGHVHPDRGTLDMPLPDDRRAEVLNAARAKEWFSGWVSKPTQRRCSRTRRHRAVARKLRRTTHPVNRSNLPMH